MAKTDEIIEQGEVTANEQINEANHSRRVGQELVHMQTELAAHNLTVADLLRTVAKHFHGITVPVYEEPKEE